MTAGHAQPETLFEAAEVLTQVEAEPKHRPRYPEYKDTGVSWLGEVPSHWSVYRAKWSVTGCKNGIWGSEPDGENDIACLRVADFDRVRLIVNAVEPTVRAITLKERQDRLLSPGDLLLEKSGGGEVQPVGAVMVFDHDKLESVCSNFVAKMPVAGGYDSWFLAYLHCHLYNRRVNVRSIKQSIGIQNLDSRQYLDEPIIHPPLVEQEAIAAYIRRETATIDALVDKKRRLIEQFRERKQAWITRSVTTGLDSLVDTKLGGLDAIPRMPVHWNTRRVRYLSTFVTSGSRGWAQYYTDDGDLFLRIGNVSRHGIELDLSDIQHVTPPEGTEGERTAVRGGDVLVSVTALTGAVAVVPDSISTAYVNQHLALVRPSREMLPRFLAYAIHSAVGQDQIRRLTYGGTKEGLGLADVKNIVVPVPPVEEQNAIVEHLDAKIDELNSVEANVQAAIKGLAEYRSALISAAVTGQIDVRGED